MYSTKRLPLLDEWVSIFLLQEGLGFYRVVVGLILGIFVLINEWTKKDDQSCMHAFKELCDIHIQFSLFNFCGWDKNIYSGRSNTLFSVGKNLWLVKVWYCSLWPTQTINFCHRKWHIPTVIAMYYHNYGGKISSLQTHQYCPIKFYIHKVKILPCADAQ